MQIEISYLHRRLYPRLLTVLSMSIPLRASPPMSSLASHSEPYYVEAAMRLGANAFVAKESGLDVLMNAVHTVREGLTGTSCSETPSLFRSSSG